MVLTTSQQVFVVTYVDYFDNEDLWDTLHLHFIFVSSPLCLAYSALSMHEW